MLARMWRKGTLLHCWWECKLVQPLWKTVCRFLKNWNITILQPSNNATRNLSKGYKNVDLKGHMYPNVYSSTNNNSHIVGRAQIFINWDKWIKKMWYVDMMEYYLVMKNGEIFPFATTWWNWRVSCWVKKVSQKKQITYVFTHVWNLRNLTEDHRGREGNRS